MIVGKKEVRAMRWEFILALVIAIPIILFPAAFVWYLNIGGIYAAIRRQLEKRQAEDRKIAANFPVGGGDREAVQTEQQKSVRECM